MRYELCNKSFSREGNKVPSLWVRMCQDAKYVWVTYEHDIVSKKEHITLYYADDPEMSCPAFMVFDSEKEVDAFIDQFNLQSQIDLFVNDGWEYN